MVSTVRSPFTGSPGGGTLPSFLLFKIFILLSRPFACFAVPFLPHADGDKWADRGGSALPVSL